MATDQISGLRQRTVDDAIDQHGTGAKGTNDKQVVVNGEVLAMDEPDERNTNKRAQEGPEMFAVVDQGFFVKYVFRGTIPPSESLFHT